MIGTIERYEADFSMDISITSDREPYVDFTIGYHLEPLTFALSKPAVSGDNNKKYNFMYCYSFEQWLLSLNDQ